MSLHLNIDTNPENLYTKAYNDRVFIGDYEIGPRDFYELIFYFMTNTDLDEDDIRYKIIADMKKLALVDGYNKGNIRLELQR